MKRVKQNMKRRAPRKTRQRLEDDRRGSVIVVVITLLATLMLLGFFLFSITQQEVQNAEIFAAASKKYEPLDVDPNTVFDCFLRQLILGADPGSEYNSIFYTGYNSLLPRFLGSDFAPYSGEGVNAVWPATGGYPTAGAYPRVDMNFDGVAEPGRDYMLRINHSPAALNQVVDVWLPTNPDGHWLPQPDVDYSYPDQNAPYLTYVGYVPILNAATGQPTGNFQKVVIPAFHRPQLIRNVAGPGLPAVATPGTTASPPPANTWYSDSSTATRVLRPHQSHMAFNDTGASAGVPRFPTSPTGILTSTFWNTVPTPDEGHWAYQNTLNGVYKYDADPTGKGWNDAVYVDIGCVPQIDSTSGRLFVPLVAATILDAESFFNLNVHGNTYGGGGNVTSAPFGGSGRFISASDQGVTRAETNLQWALNSLPVSESTDPASLDQYRYFFGYGPNADNRWTELSNMDLWFLLHGRPEFGTGSPVPAGLGNKIAQYDGRYGEPGRMDAGIQSRFQSDFSWPGTTGFDDNKNELLGVFLSNPGNNFAYAAGYPYDIYGSAAAALSSSNNRSRSLVPDTMSPYVHPAFANVIGNVGGNGIEWGRMKNGALITPNTDITIVDEALETVTDPSLAGLQTDDAIFTPAESAQLQLSRFDLSVTGTTGRLLNLAPFNFNFSSREEKIRGKFTTHSSDLKSYSRSYYAQNGLFGPSRNWEFVDVDADGNRDFPPVVSTVPLGTNLQPFRPELHDLLYQEVANHNYNPDPDFRKLQRKLSVNGVLDVDLTNNNKLFFRPPAVHPPLSSSAPVTTLSPFRSSHIANLTAGDLPGQEILARVDRQKMARDIYTLLYVFGGGRDNINYLGVNNDPINNPAGAVYTLAQCREMAQFAVNLVDYYDADHISTKFEYDINLADGWNLDDYPYAGVGFPQLPGGDTVTDVTSTAAGVNKQRGVVYGVEEQLVCLSEGAAIYTDQVRDSSNNLVDHEATEWDDKERHQFFFLELMDVSPYDLRRSAVPPVIFPETRWNINNEMFQVVLQPKEWAQGKDPLRDPATRSFNERRITLTNGALDKVRVGFDGRDRMFAIGSAAKLSPTSSTEQNDSMTGDPVVNNGVPMFPSSNFLDAPPGGPGTNPGPSRMRVSQNYDAVAHTSSGPATIYPYRTNSNYFRYVDALNNVNRFRLFRAPSNADDYQDGKEFTGSNKGAELLDLPDPVTFDSNGTRYVEVTLRRRANPTRLVNDPTDAAESEDNPWVVVDRMMVPLRHFALKDQNDSGGQIESYLQACLSQGRPQHLYGNPLDCLSTTSWDQTMYKTNSIGDRISPDTLNENTPNRMTLYHYHPNRDFVSLAEVLNVPLFGPDRLNETKAPLYDYDPGTAAAPDPDLDPDPTTGLGAWRGLTVKLGSNLGGGPQAAKLAGYDTFGERVRHPEGPDGAFNTADDNRWHRVLGFLEVPTRQNIAHVPNLGYVETVGKLAAGQQDQVYRNFGPVNINTMKNPEVYAGIIDDPYIVNYGGIPANHTTDLPRLFDASGADTYRQDWWSTFVLSRDQYDPVLAQINPATGIPNGTYAPIPGMPGVSVPFRPMTYNAAGVNSIRHTLLRGLPRDDTNSDRNLFEVGLATDNTNKNVDYDLKNQVLAKMMTASTTQSNTFFVFLQVDYFEANNMGNGVVQIGGKLPDSPGYRGFFVIDRAKALELLTRDDLPPTADPNTGKNTFSFNQNFDWRALVLHRQRLN